MFGANNNDTQGQVTDSSQPAAAPENPFVEASSAATVSPAPPAAAFSAASDAAGPVSLASSPAAANDALMTLKQEALQSLQPLVNHLDQTPEEKFKTTMMLIQATDNPSLVKEAYAAANQIADEKTRAQALLDVVNEINYFTHKDEK